jgi:hypothetical protein
MVLLGEKKMEGLAHSSDLNVRNMKFTTHSVASTDPNLNQKSGKKQGSVLNTYNLSDRQFKDG